MSHKDKSLNQLLDEAGIETIRTESDVYLEYNGKRIARPRCDRCYDVVKKEFGIDFTTFNDQ